MTRTNIRYKIKLQKKEVRDMKIKRNFKILLGIYLGTFIFAYFISIRMQKLEIQEDLRNKNESIVLRVN